MGCSSDCHPGAHIAHGYMEERDEKLTLVHLPISLPASLDGRAECRERDTRPANPPRRQIPPYFQASQGRARCTEEIPLQLPGREREKATLLQRKLRVPFLFNCQSLTDKGREEDIGGKGLSLSLCRGRSNERLSVSLSSLSGH